jgi:hypothetical protein
MSEASIPNAEPAAASRSFADRLVGVLRLDGATYDEIGADANAGGQAATVVALATIGRALSAEGGPLSTQGLLFLVQIPLLWPVLSGLVAAMGQWFGTPAPFARVLRIVGFAMAPFALAAFGAVPVEPVQVAAAFLSTALLIATLVVGVRHALSTSLGWAGFVCLVIFLILIFVSIAYVFVTS